MYHLAELYREVQQDVHTRYEGSTLAAYTPIPFLYSLSLKASTTLKRKSPEIVRNSAVWGRDRIVDVFGAAKNSTSECVRGATCSLRDAYLNAKQTAETMELPPVLVPIQDHIIKPMFITFEEFAKFVISDDMKELYLVAKARVGENVFGRNLIIPCIVALESIVQFMIILPTRVVFPSREEVETGADTFIGISTSSLQSLVEHLYSATIVIDQHLTMAQWNILGRGPYASLTRERQLEIIKAIQQRRLRISSPFKQYEFMASIKTVNEMLYHDLLEKHSGIGAIPLTPEEISANIALSSKLESLNETTYPCWVHAPEGSTRWTRFPEHESRRLERAFCYKYTKENNSSVLVDEGRYEVNLDEMCRTPVYWPTIEHENVHRAIWLYADRDYKIIPYSSEVSTILEAAFVFFVAYIEEEKRFHLFERQQKKSSSISLSIPVEDHLVEFRSANEIYQYKRLLAGTTPFTSRRRVYRGDPRIRNSSDFEGLRLWKEALLGQHLENAIDDQDLHAEINHLVLIVHGIGEALRTIDLNVVQLRSIIQCADSLRSLHKDAILSPHFNDIPQARDGKVEFLPVEWHSKFHCEDGPDEGIRNITLPSIPKLRAFANDTILDVLFFMAPTFHQTIIECVTKELNRVFDVYKNRNTSRFSGKVSIVAHSLGAIICFDILSNQQEFEKKRDKDMDNRTLTPTRIWPDLQYSMDDLSPTRYPLLCFSVHNLFTLGSPIGMFIQVRGQYLSPEYKLPTCNRFYNIFHPYDPVAYRIEPLISGCHISSIPTIIPTFEGGYRYQYQLKHAVKTLWKGLKVWKTRVESKAEQVAEMIGLIEDNNSLAQNFHCSAHRTHEGSNLIYVPTTPRNFENDEITDYGALCEGRPIDYALQENELEVTNEYLFALTAHVFYWGSRDASLFIAKHLFIDHSITNMNSSGGRNSSLVGIRNQIELIRKRSNLCEEKLSKIERKLLELKKNSY